MTFIRGLFLGEFPLLWSLFILGCCVGSFLNVCILRIPEGTFFKSLRSQCPSCGKMIPFYFNVPVLGFFMLRGKAHCCGAKLSWQYPMIELIVGLLFLGLYLKFPFMGWSQASIIFDLNDFLRYFHAVLFLCLMLVMSVIDARHMIIPDVLSLGMIACSPLVFWIHPDLDGQSSLIGIVLGGGILYAVAWGYWLLRKQYGMGFGDVKLLAAIGGWLGWQAVFPTLFLGSIVGSFLSIGILLLAKRLSWQTKIPFGPYLAAGAVTHLLWGQQIFEWLSAS